MKNVLHHASARAPSGYFIIENIFFLALGFEPTTFRLMFFYFTYSPALPETPKLENFYCILGLEQDSN